MPDGTAPAPDEARIEDAVRRVLASLGGDLTLREALLLGELHELNRTIARAKAEIAALSVGDITVSHIPAAADELDAIVEHTAQATNTILDSCEALEAMGAGLQGEAAEILQAAVTRIYEACSFQDLTGQRIGKVVRALKAIEARVDAAVAAAAGEAPMPADIAPATEGERLAEGPQLPAAAASQEDIDRLLASFD
ncbi:MAG TPA: protein phosphatase CheZ [Acetobacteraceae bacterium]|nr:protein phosphatase CheZ [Acetobacteraceae bacterium]